MTISNRALPGDIKTWSQGHMVIWEGELPIENSCHQENTCNFEWPLWFKSYGKGYVFLIVGQIGERDAEILKMMQVIRTGIVTSLQDVRMKVCQSEKHRILDDKKYTISLN